MSEQEIEGPSAPAHAEHSEQPVSTPRNEPLSPIYAHWLWGAGRLQFQARFRFGKGKGGIHSLTVNVSHAEIALAAARLRAAPDASHYEYDQVVQRGRGRQIVGIPVPRDVLLGIADALAGAVDADDAGHRFWHRDNPDSPRPCSTCRETLDAEGAKVDALRAAFLARHARALQITPERLAAILAEYDRLPTKRRRR